MTHPAVVHAARRADLARRGVPRRRRRAPRCTAPAPSSRPTIRAPGARRDRAHRRRSASPPPSCWPSWRATSPSPTACSSSSPAPSSSSSTRSRSGGCGASGPRPSASWRALGVRTVGELAAMPEDTLVRDARQRVGSAPARAGLEPRRPPGRARPGGEVDRARGDVPGRPPRPRRARARDRRAWPTGSASRLRAAGVAARTVQLKVRFGDFRTITRSRTLPEPTDLAADLGRVARELLGRARRRPGVRLLGVSVQQLVRPDPGPVRAGAGAGAGRPFGRGAGPGDAVRRGRRERSGGAETAPGPDRQAALERSVDAVRARFGPGAVGPGAATSLPREGPGRPTR